MKIHDVLRGLIFAAVTTAVLFAAYSGAMALVSLLGIQIGLPVALFSATFLFLLYVATAYHAGHRRAIEDEKAKELDVELARLLNNN